MGSILKWALLIGAGYLLYRSGILSGILAQFGIGAPAAAAPPATTTTPPAPTGGGSPTPAPPPPAYVYTPPTTAQALLAAAAPQTSLNADQWRWYYERLPGKSPIPETTFMTLFFPNGRPPAGTAMPNFDVNTFLAGLATQGLNGISPLPLPDLVRRARTGDVLAAARLSQYGVRMQQKPADMIRKRMAVSGLAGLNLGGIPMGRFRV